MPSEVPRPVGWQPLRVTQLPSVFPPQKKSQEFLVPGCSWDVFLGGLEQSGVQAGFQEVKF